VKCNQTIYGKNAYVVFFQNFDWRPLAVIQRDRRCYKNTSARGTDHPPFSNFLFTNLFSIKFLHFFIISSLFPYFNLFVSIFIQSYVNIKLHVSTLLDTNNTQGMQLRALKIVPLLASSTFIAPYFHYVIQTRTCIHS
jgi:hypothetical protein